LVSAEPRLDLRRGDLLLRIPKSFQTIKEQDHELASQWRVYTRSVFTNYFGRGWTVTGFVPGIHYNTYVLQK
jgi:predicted GNAT superfamily acetyltransferase